MIGTHLEKSSDHPSLLVLDRLQKTHTDKCLEANLKHIIIIIKYDIDNYNSNHNNDNNNKVSGFVSLVVDVGDCKTN